MAKGATDYHACITRDRWGRCRCERCARCGWGKHTAIHGPAYGHLPGSEPVGHEFESGEWGGMPSTSEEVLFG